MKRGIKFIVLWFILAVFLAGIFEPAYPPGGVDWPYYPFMVFIPVGAFLYARYQSKASVALCYGLVAGAWFALPIFDFERKLMFGDAETTASIALKFGLFAILMSAVCCGAFAIGRRFLKPIETHAAR